MIRADCAAEAASIEYELGRLQSELYGLEKRAKALGLNRTVKKIETAYFSVNNAACQLHPHDPKSELSILLAEIPK
ncbi:MAG: hypothetical protein LBL59_07345 [Xanthomonadaceae bacterium]|jgi:hypothetical protein|nr:hypothetical protein [Xanthomonadaceae bacterium]